MFRAGGGMRILVIEDEPRILSFLVKGLEAEGFTVESAVHGVAALERARAAMENREARGAQILQDLLLECVQIQIHFVEASALC